MVLERSLMVPERALQVPERSLKIPERSLRDSTGCPKKNASMFKTAITPSKVALGIKVR